MLTLSGAGQPQNGGAGIEERFVISVKTDINGGSADDQFTVPTRFGGYNYTIETSDGQTINNVTGNYTITFPSPGIYDIMISGDFPWYRGVYSPDPGKLIDIKNWGTNPWLSFAGAFNGAPLTTITAADIPNLESVGSMHDMFVNASALLSVPNIENWDMSNVTSIRGMFSRCFLFSKANPSTPDLSNWDTSNISDFSYAFYDGSNTGSKVDFDMSGWNVENMTQAITFIGGYNTDSLSTANYDALLISWAAQDVNSNVTFTIGNAKYSYEAAAARQTLIDTYGWTITDGGEAVSPEFALKWETTTPNEEIQIGVGSGIFDYVIDWGDGTVESYNTDANISHIYADAGDHITKITGDFPSFKNLANTPFQSKLKDILNWGDQIFDFLHFQRSYGLSIISATNIPNFSSNGVGFSFAFNRTALISGIENWDTTNVIDVSYMFNNTSSIDMSFANWNIENIGNFKQFLPSSTLSRSNYDATLISWAAQSPGINKDVSFGGSQYTLGGAAEAARNTLINTYGWTITDGGGIFVGVLDTYPGASVAYSLRDLASASLGSAVVRVRRSSDNTEQNFTSTEITNGALATFCSGTDGFVTTWYDQSGNSLNLLQSSATSQPKIVDNGALILENGLPVVFYSDSGGLDKNLKTSVGVLIEQPTSYFSVAQLNTGQASFLFDSLNSSTDRQTSFEGYNQTNFSMDAGTQLILTTDTNELNNLFSLIFNGSNSSGRMNGIELVSGDAGERKQEWGTLGCIRNQPRYNAKSISEFIIYENDESGNQIGIENNINNYYISSPTSGFLSDYPTASAAYSLRSLANTVTNVIRVRRSNDNTEQDFTATQIIDGTLTTFTGANDGCVTTWYNQASNFGANNQDVAQTTASRQPKIVVNGVLQTKNSKPTLIFNKVNSSSLFGNKILRLNSPNDFCSFGVGALNDNNVPGILFSNTIFSFRRIGSFLSSTINMVVGNTTVSNNIALEDNLNLITSYRSGNIMNGKTNGTELNSATPENNYGNDRLSIGIQFNNNTAIDGCISEIIIYPTDQNSNITGIETNINNEYTIY